jgi:hypothetical protein
MVLEGDHSPQNRTPAIQYLVHLQNIMKTFHPLISELVYHQHHVGQ